VQRVVIRKWSPPKEPLTINYVIADLVETTEGQNGTGNRHVN
jgi:hypothetical protein